MKVCQGKEFRVGEFNGRAAREIFTSLHIQTHGQSRRDCRGPARILTTRSERIQYNITRLGLASPKKVLHFLYLGALDILSSVPSSIYMPLWNDYSIRTTTRVYHSPMVRLACFMNDYRLYY